MGGLLMEGNLAASTNLSWAISTTSAQDLEKSELSLEKKLKSRRNSNRRGKISKRLSASSKSARIK